MSRIFSLAMTLRGRLALLVCLATLPALLFTFYVANNERNAALNRMIEEAHHVVSIVSREHLYQIAGAKSLLLWLGGVLSHQNAEKIDSRFFSALVAGYPQLANIAVLTPDGNVISSAYPFQNATNMQSFTAIHDALTSHDIAVGKYVMGPIVNRPVLHLAYAIRDEKDSVKSVAFVAIDLEWLKHLTETADLPAAYKLLILDRDGQILAFSGGGIEEGGGIGAPIPALALAVMQTQNLPVEISLNGEKQSFFVRPMEGVPGVLVAAGIPFKVVYEKANSIFYRTLGSLALLTLFTVISVLVVTEVTLLRSVRRMSYASQRFGMGDFAARATIPHGYGELQEMAQAFNAMAEMLSRRHREIIEANNRLNLLTRHLQMARETEGHRIARDLHDEAGQVMTSIKMDLASLRKKCARDTRCNGCSDMIDKSIAEMSTKIDGVIEFIRHLASDLRPPVLDRMGLSAAIGILARDLENQAGLVAEAQISDLQEPVNWLVSITLYRIVQEALTNISRHAQAATVHINLHESQGAILLVIADDGVGMECAGESPESLGIIGMRERAHLVGGDFDITSKVGAGVVITVNIPQQPREGGDGAHIAGG